MQAPAINPWAMPVGAATVGAVILGIAVWHRRQRKLRRERPPNTRKLLRPPGHTLSGRLETCHEKLLETFAWTAGAGAIGALLISTVSPVLLSSETVAWISSNGLQRTLSSRPLLPALLGDASLLIGCICGAVWGILRCLELMRKSRVLHLGLRGEQAVAEALAEAAGLGYRSFHDFPGGEEWNIDHVVVGPAGVFAIETKTRSKGKAPPGVKDYEVAYDGITFVFPWGEKNKDYVEQAKRNAKSLAAFLGKSTGMKVWVNPVLVLPVWYVTLSNPLVHEVRAMPETALLKYLRDLPASLSDQQIQQIAFQVDQKCRDVDF